MVDKLEKMFELQKMLNKRIGVDTDKMTDDERIEWILNYSRALGQELAELVDSVPWKWWAKYQDFKKQNVKVEIVDIFHFLISLAQTLNLTADDIFQGYLKKNKINLERQDSGYITKDDQDSKEI